MNKAIIDKVIDILTEAENAPVEDGNVMYNKIARAKGILETVSSILEDATPVVPPRITPRIGAQPPDRVTTPPVPRKGADGVDWAVDDKDFNPFPNNEPK